MSPLKWSSKSLHPVKLHSLNLFSAFHIDWDFDIQVKNAVYCCYKTWLYNFKKSKGDIDMDAMANELQKHLKRYFRKSN